MRRGHDRKCQPANPHGDITRLGQQRAAPMNTQDGRIDAAQHRVSAGQATNPRFLLFALVDIDTRTDQTNWLARGIPHGLRAHLDPLVSAADEHAQLDASKGHTFGQVLLKCRVHVRDVFRMHACLELLTP